MRLRAVNRVTVRILLVLVIGLGMTAITAVLLPRQGPLSFQATARLMLLLPSDSGRVTTNPYLIQQNGLVVLGNLIAEAPFSDSARDELGALGLQSQFEIGLDPSNPIVTLSVEGNDPDDVIATRDWIVHLMQQELFTLQQEVGVPDRQLAVTHLFMMEPVAHHIHGDPTRALIGILAAGGLLSVLGAAIAAQSGPLPRRALKRSDA